MPEFDAPFRGPSDASINLMAQPLMRFLGDLPQTYREGKTAAYLQEKAAKGQLSFTDIANAAAQSGDVNTLVKLAPMLLGQSASGAVQSAFAGPSAAAPGASSAAPQDAPLPATATATPPPPPPPEPERTSSPPPPERTSQAQQPHAPWAPPSSQWSSVGRYGTVDWLAKKALGDTPDEQTAAAEISKALKVKPGAVLTYGQSARAAGMLQNRVNAQQTETPTPRSTVRSGPGPTPATAEPATAAPVVPPVATPHTDRAPLPPPAAQIERRFPQPSPTPQPSPAEQIQQRFPRPDESMRQQQLYAQAGPVPGTPPTAAPRAAPPPVDPALRSLVPRPYWEQYGANAPDEFKRRMQEAVSAPNVPEGARQEGINAIRAIDDYQTKRAQQEREKALEVSKEKQMTLFKQYQQLDQGLAAVASMQAPMISQYDHQAQLLQDPNFTSGAGWQAGLVLRQLAPGLFGKPQAMELYKKDLANTISKNTAMLKSVADSFGDKVTRIFLPQIYQIQDMSGTMETSPAGLRALVEMNRRVAVTSQQFADFAMGWKDRSGRGWQNLPKEFRDEGKPASPGELDDRFEDGLRKYALHHPMLSSEEIANPDVLGAKRYSTWQDAKRAGVQFNEPIRLPPTRKNPEGPVLYVPRKWPDESAQ